MNNHLFDDIAPAPAPGNIAKSKSIRINLFDYAPDAILVIGKTGVIIRANAQAEQMFGYDRSELIGKSVELLVPERFRERHINHRRNYNADPHTRPMSSAANLCARRKDGTEIPVDISLSPVRREAEFYVIAIIRDVTERRAAREAAQQRVHELQALLEIGQVIISTSDIESVSGEILDKTLTVTNLDLGLICFFDQARKEHRVLVSRGYRNPQRVRPLSVDPENLEAAQVLAEVLRGNNFYTVENLQAVDGFRTFKSEGAQSIIVIAIKSAGEIVGTLQLGSRIARKFPPETVRLLETIGQQLGLGIQKDRLRQAERANLERLRGLYEVNMAMTSTLDLRSTLALLLEKASSFLPYPVATVRLLNEKTGCLEAVACRNLDEKEWKTLNGTTFHSPAQIIVSSRQPLIIENVQQDPRVLRRDFYRKHELVSYLGVPLVVKDTFVGVLGFFTKETRVFTADEIDLAVTLAAQASVAIHNARLYTTIAQREEALSQANQRLQALYSITAAATQSLNSESVLTEAIRKVTEIFAFDATRIFLFDPARENLVLRAAYETTPQLFAGLNTFPRGSGVIGRAVATGEPFVFEDIHSDTRYAAVSGTQRSIQIGQRFLAVFPIKSKSEAIGGMLMSASQPRSLTVMETELLAAIAGQLAIAVENANLFEEIARKAVELTARTKELEQANKAKEEFLSVVSHELRTPLNVIMGHTTLMREGTFGAVNSKQERSLATIIRQSKGLLNLVNNILEVTQISSRTSQPGLSEVNPSQLLDALKHAWDLPMEKELVIQWDYSPALPVVKTDGLKVYRVLQNLIDNAIKFTDRGLVKVSARVVDAGAKNSENDTLRGGQKTRLEFEVADTGTGIPKDSIPVIFGMFRQLDGSETRRHEGVGLGLYIVKQYAELLDGDIRVASELGKGSVFTFSIPADI